MEHIMNDSGAALVITERHNSDLAHELSEKNIQIVNIDDLGRNYSSVNPVLSISPDRVSYVMYTSGSTGMAKGVFQNHRNLLHMVMAHTEALHICQEDRVALTHTFGSVGSVRGIMGTLLNGAALFPYDLKLESLAGMSDWLIREKITYIRSVPTVFRNLISESDGSVFSDIRLLYLGSEPIYASDFELFKNHFSKTALKLQSGVIFF